MSNIKVAIRVRPTNRKEQEKKSNVIVNVQNNNVVQIHNVKLEGQIEAVGDSRERIKLFGFDYAYNSLDPSTPGYASQELVFQDLGTDVLQASFEGFNTCVFAYGQTGSGKTYTMMGNPPGEVGLIPRLCENLFTRIHDACDEVEEEERVSFNVSISYLEIYNERVRDLLSPTLSRSDERYTLKVREHPKDGPFVEGLSKHTVKDNKAIQAFINRGNENRTTAATHFHDRSSRSHAIFTITFTQSKYDEASQLPSEKVSKINLVDLAGSERADPNSHYNKGRLKEGANINKSLVTLGNVIQSLAERSLLEWSQRQDSMLGSTFSLYSPESESRESLNSLSSGTTPSGAKKSKLYIPYRDSILTWLLKDSLGGNSKTIMIATVSPSDLYYHETLSTLRYAQRAKSIVNKPVINEDANVSLIRELKEEVGRLKVLLAAKWPERSNSVSTQAGSMSSVSETSSCIAEKMENYEVKAKELTQEWLVNRWQETQEIMKDPYFKMHLKRVSRRSNSLPGHASDSRPSTESDMSINPVHLGRRSSSMGVIVDSHLPHLIGIDDDLLSTGVVMYHLKEGKTHVGSEEAGREMDIYLSGQDILHEHCVIRHVNGDVVLHPITGAYVKVNDKVFTQPIILSQGDIIFLGKSNMFRFNNPMQAAKLRQNRKAQYGDTRLPGALSRWSSLGSMTSPGSPELDSIGGSLPASPVIKRGPSWNDLCVDMERSHSTEEERIQKARDDLEKLQREQRQAEHARLEKEDEMWKLHEKHKMELEAEKEALRERIRAFEEEKLQAELDLEERRRQVDEDSAKRDEELKAKQAQIYELEQRHQAEMTQATQDFPIATMPDLGSLALQTESQMSYVARGGLSAEKESQKLVDIMAKLQDEADQMMKTRQDEQEQLKQKQMEIEEMFLTESEKVELEKKRLKEKEKSYRDEDASIFKSMSVQTDIIEQLEHRKVQLVQYIEAKEQDMGGTREGTLRESPVGDSTSSYSTGSLTSSPRVSRKTAKPTSLSLNTLSHDHPRYPHSESLSSPKPPLSPATSRKDTSHAGARPKSKTSIAAQNVTDRLYNAKEIRQQATAAGRKFHEATKRTKTKTPIYKTRSKQRLRRHTNSSSSLASVPETADELDEESKTVAGLHIANYDKEPVRLRNKPHLRGDNRPHSWAATDNRLSRRVMITPNLETALQEGSMESVSDMEYIDADTPNESMSRTDSESGLDPALEERLGPEGKERTDSLTSCKGHIPAIQVNMVTDQQHNPSLPQGHQHGNTFNTFHRIHPSDLQVQDFMETSETGIDTLPTPASPKQPKSSTSSPATTRKGKKSNTTKKSSVSESPPVKKKRPKSATLHDKQQPITRPRTASSTSIHSQSELSPRLVRSSNTSSDKLLGSGKKKTSSRTSSVGSISPQSSPKVKRKSDKTSGVVRSSPESRTKADKKKKVHDSKDKAESQGVDKRPLTNNNSQSSEHDRQKKKLKSAGTEASASSVLNDNDVFSQQNTTGDVAVSSVDESASSDLVTIAGHVTKDTEDTMEDTPDGQMMSIKKIGKRKKTPKSAFDGLSTQELHAEYLDSIVAKLTKEQRKQERKSLNAQELLSDYQKMLVQKLKEEDKESSECFSDDSLDNVTVDNFDLEAEKESVLVPASKKPKLDPAEDASKQSVLPISSVQDRPESVNHSILIPHPLPGHDEADENPSIFSVPSIDLPTAILRSEPASIPYYFRSGFSRSEPDIYTNITGNNPQGAKTHLSERPKSAGYAKSRPVSKGITSPEQSLASNDPNKQGKIATTSRPVEQATPQTEVSSRRSCKYRESRKRQQEQPAESESGQQTDDSLHSGIKSKSNGRPSPATRRRRRQPRSDHTQGRTRIGMSSEEYVTSEDGESNFSEDSLHSEGLQDTMDIPLAEEARHVVTEVSSMTSALEGEQVKNTDNISEETQRNGQEKVVEGKAEVMYSEDLDKIADEVQQPVDGKVPDAVEEMSEDELNNSVGNMTDLNDSIEDAAVPCVTKISNTQPSDVIQKVTSKLLDNVKDNESKNKEDDAISLEISGEQTAAIEDPSSQLPRESSVEEQVMSGLPSSKGGSGSQDGNGTDNRDHHILSTEDMENALYATSAAAITAADDSKQDTHSENNITQLDSNPDDVPCFMNEVRGSADGSDSSDDDQSGIEGAEEVEDPGTVVLPTGKDTEQASRGDLNGDIDSSQSSDTEDRFLEPKLSIREYVHNISIPSSMKSPKSKNLTLTAIETWGNYSFLTTHSESSSISFEGNPPETTNCEESTEDGNPQYDVVSLVGPDADRPLTAQAIPDKLRLDFEVLPGRPITKEFVVAKLQKLNVKSAEDSSKPKPLSRNNSDVILSDSSMECEYTCEILSRTPGVTEDSETEPTEAPVVEVQGNESNDNESIHYGDSLDESSDVDMNEDKHEQTRLQSKMHHDAQSELSVDTDSLYQDSVSESAMDTDSIDVGGPLSENDLCSRETSPEKSQSLSDIMQKGSAPEYTIDDTHGTESVNTGDRRVNFIENPNELSDKSTVPPELLEDVLDQKQRETLPEIEAVVGHVSANVSVETGDIVQTVATAKDLEGVDGEKPLEGTRNNRDSGYYSISRDSTGYQFTSPSESESDSHDQSSNKEGAMTVASPKEEQRFFSEIQENNNADNGSIPSDHSTLTGSANSSANRQIENIEAVPINNDGTTSHSEHLPTNSYQSVNNTEQPQLNDRSTEEMDTEDSVSEKDHKTLSGSSEPVTTHTEDVPSIKITDYDTQTPNAEEINEVKEDTDQTQDTVIMESLSEIDGDDSKGNGLVENDTQAVEMHEDLHEMDGRERRTDMMHQEGQGDIDDKEVIANDSAERESQEVKRHGHVQANKDMKLQPDELAEGTAMTTGGSDQTPDEQMDESEHASSQDNKFQDTPATEDMLITEGDSQISNPVDGMFDQVNPLDVAPTKSEERISDNKKVTPNAAGDDETSQQTPVDTQERPTVEVNIENEDHFVETSEKRNQLVDASDFTPGHPTPSEAPIGTEQTPPADFTLPQSVTGTHDAKESLPNAVNDDHTTKERPGATDDLSTVEANGENKTYFNEKLSDKTNQLDVTSNAAPDDVIPHEAPVHTEPMLPVHVTVTKSETSTSDPKEVLPNTSHNNQTTQETAGATDDLSRAEVDIENESNINEKFSDKTNQLNVTEDCPRDHLTPREAPVDTEPVNPVDLTTIQSETSIPDSKAVLPNASYDDQITQDRPVATDDQPTVEVEHEDSDQTNLPQAVPQAVLDLTPQAALDLTPHETPLGSEQMSGVDFVALQSGESTSDTKEVLPNTVHDGQTIQETPLAIEKVSTYENESENEASDRANQLDVTPKYAPDHLTTRGTPVGSEQVSLVDSNSENENDTYLISDEINPQEVTDQQSDKTTSMTKEPISDEPHGSDQGTNERYVGTDEMEVDVDGQNENPAEVKSNRIDQQDINDNQSENTTSVPNKVNPTHPHKGDQSSHYSSVGPQDERPVDEKLSEKQMGAENQNNGAEAVSETEPVNDLSGQSTTDAHLRLDDDITANRDMSNSGVTTTEHKFPVSPNTSQENVKTSTSKQDTTDGLHPRQASDELDEQMEVTEVNVEGQDACEATWDEGMETTDIMHPSQDQEQMDTTEPQDIGIQSDNNSLTVMEIENGLDQADPLDGPEVEESGLKENSVIQKMDMKGTMVVSTDLLTGTSESEEKLLVQSDKTEIDHTVEMDISEEEKSQAGDEDTSEVQMQKVLNAVRQIDDIFDQAGQHIQSGHTESEGSISVDEDGKDQVDSMDVMGRKAQSSAQNRGESHNAHNLYVQADRFHNASPAVSDCDVLYENILQKEAETPQGDIVMKVEIPHEDIVSDQSGSELHAETKNQYNTNGSFEQTAIHSAHSNANELERANDNDKPAGIEKHSGEQESLSTNNTLNAPLPIESVEKVPKSENILGQQGYVDRELEFSMIDQPSMQDGAAGQDNNTIQSISDPMSSNGTLDICIEPSRTDPECLPEKERANLQREALTEPNSEEDFTNDHVHDTSLSENASDKLLHEIKLDSSVIDVNNPESQAVGLETSEVSSSERDIEVETGITNSVAREKGSGHSLNEYVTDISENQDSEHVEGSGEVKEIVSGDHTKGVKENNSSFLDNKETSERGETIGSDHSENVCSDPESIEQDSATTSPLEEKEVINNDVHSLTEETTNKHKRNTQTEQCYEGTGTCTEEKLVDNSFDLSGDIVEIISREELGKDICESSEENNEVNEYSDQPQEHVKIQETDESDSPSGSQRTGIVTGVCENEASEADLSTIPKGNDKTGELGVFVGENSNPEVKVKVILTDELDMDTNGVDYHEGTEEKVDETSKSGSKPEIADMEGGAVNGATSADDLVQEESKDSSKKSGSDNGASNGQQNRQEVSPSNDTTPPQHQGASTLNGHHEAQLPRDSRPQGAVGGHVAPRQQRPDQFTDPMVSLSTDTSFDEGYTTMLGSPRSESVDDVLRHSRYTSENETLNQSMEKPPTGEDEEAEQGRQPPVVVPRLNLGSLIQNGDSANESELSSLRRSSERGELQGESRFVEVLEPAEPRPDPSEEESTRFMDVIGASQSTLPENSIDTSQPLVNREIEDVEMAEYNQQYDTPPRSPPATPTDSPRPIPPTRMLSESDLMQGQMASNMQSTSGTSSQNLTKSDLHLQPAKDSDQQLFAGSAEEIQDEETAESQDAGSFEVVHYKEPEPRSKKRKKQKVDKSEKAKELHQSETNILTNDDIDELEEQFNQEGNSYTTIRDTQNPSDPVDAAGILENSGKRTLRKEMSVVVNVDENEEKDELDDTEIEYIRRVSESANEDVSMEPDEETEKSEEPVDLNVGEILQNSGKKPLKKEISVVVNVDETESTEDIDEQEIAYIRGNTEEDEQNSDTDSSAMPRDYRLGSLVVNVGELDDNLSEDEISRLKEQGQDFNDAIEEISVSQPENAVPPDEGVTLRRNDESVIVNLDENERNEITEEDIKLLGIEPLNQSDGDEDNFEGNMGELNSLPEVGENLSTIPISHDPSLIVQIDENEQQDQITEEEIEMMKERGQNMNRDDSDEEVTTANGNVGFFIGGEMPGSEQLIHEDESNASLHRFIEAVEQERKELKGSQDNETVDNKPLSDSAFSSDYTDPTHSDLTDSELSPIHRHYGAKEASTQDSQSAKNRDNVSEANAGSCEKNVPSSRARADSEGAEDVHFVNLGDNGRADSIEEIQQLPSPRSDTADSKPRKEAVFKDTKVVGFDVCYDDTRPGSPGLPIPDGHQIVTGTQITISVSGNSKKAKPYSEMQVLGLQPSSVTPPSNEPEKEVLIDEPSHPCQRNLTHTSLNIEIRPWRSELEQSINMNQDNFSSAYMGVPGALADSEHPVDYISESKGSMDRKRYSETFNIISDDKDDSGPDESTTENTNLQHDNAEVVKEDDLGFNVEIIDSDTENISTDHVPTTTQHNYQSSEIQRETGISKSQPDIDRSQKVGGEQRRGHAKSPVRIGLTSDQRKIGEITDSATEFLGSDRELFEGLVPSFPDLQETVGSSTSIQDDSISKRMTKSMDDSIITSSDSQLVQKYEDSEEETEEEQTAFKEQKMKMFQDAGKMLFDQDESYSPSISLDESESDISDVEIIKSDIMDLEEGEYETGSDRSPGELRMPVSRDTLASSTSSLLSDEDKQAMVNWPDIVSELPEMMTDSLKDIRNDYMRRYHRNNLRSLSMSELEYIEPRDWYDGMSFSLDCVNLNFPFERAMSNDSITYVFVAPARSLDAWTQDFANASNEPRLASATSEPTCTEKEMRHKYGIDEDILPFKGRTQSVEDISEGTAQITMSTRRRSQSIDESRLLASESKRSSSPDLTPETVFGGMMQTVDDRVTERPPLPDFVQPRPGDEPVRLRKKRQLKETNKRVSWGDVEEKLDTYNASPVDKDIHGQDNTPAERPVLVEMGVQTSGSLEDIQQEGGVICLVEDEANVEESQSSQTNADTVLSNARDQSNSLMSMSSEVTDAQTSPIPFDSLSYETNSSLQRYVTSDIELSEPSSLIQEALQKLRTAMGSQTEISVVDSQDIPPGTPLRVHHYTTEISQTPDDMMYPPKEGPLSVSSPKEEEIQSHRPVKETKPGAARQLLTGNEGYINEQLQNVEDIDTPQKQQSHGSTAMPPSTDEAFVEELPSYKPAQPVGRARPMQGHLSEADTLTNEKWLSEEELMRARLDSHQYGLPLGYAPQYMIRLPSDYPRTIETQTWPDVRVIETQTNLENRVIETQTSPHFFNEAGFTQTESLETLPMAVQTEDPEWNILRPQVFTMETGCNPSPPRGFSPIDLAAQTDVSIFNMFDDRFCQTDNYDAYIELEVQKALQREQIENAKMDEKEVESIGIQAGSPHLDDAIIETNEPVSVQRRSPLQMPTVDIPEEVVPIYSFTDPSLSTLRAEHEKLMQLFSKSKDDRESSIAKRKKLKEKKREEVLNELEQSMSESMYSSTTDLESTNDIQAGAPEFRIDQQISVIEDTFSISEQNSLQIEINNSEVSVSQKTESEEDKIESQSVNTGSGSDMSNGEESSQEQPITENEEAEMEIKPGEMVKNMSEPDLGTVQTENTPQEDSGLEGQVETMDQQVWKAQAVEELVMSDEFFFTIQESAGNDAAEEEDFTGHAEELAGSVVDIAVDIGHTDEEDEFFLVPEEASKEMDGRQASGQSPLQYEKITESKEENVLSSINDGNYRNVNRVNILNESVASSTAAEVQEILQDAQQDIGDSDELTNLKDSEDKASKDTKSVFSDKERPVSCTTSTQYEEEDFGMAVSNQEAKQESTQITSGTSTETRVTEKQSDIKSIIEKYQTIKKLVGSEEVSERPSSALSSSGTQYEDLPKVGARKRNNSAGSSGAFKKDAVLDQSFDISLSESFTGSEMKDESIETDNLADYSDELERLRRERQRILDMLAKDIMPSKLQVELAEAQLNYIIGQTDILLNTIDEPMDWDIQALSQHSSFPEEQLGEISKEYLTRYRHSLEMSKKHIDKKIVELEKKKDRTERARKRTKQFAKLRREAAIEAFVIERQREQNTFDRTIRSAKARTPSDSPMGRSNSEPQSRRSGAVSANVLTPMQRKQHLTNLRKGLVRYTDQERSRSVSPLSSAPSSPRSRSANSTTSHSHGLHESSYSPYRSTYLAQYDPQAIHSPRSSSLGSVPPGRDISPRVAGPYSTSLTSSSMRDLSPRGAYGHGRSRTTSGSFSLYGDSDTMSIGSLDEDTQRLLGDVQQVRGRTSQEIQKAKKVLEKKSPSQSPRPNHISPARGRYLHYTPTDMYGIVTSAVTAAEVDRRAQDRIERIEQRDTRTSSHTRASPLVLSTSAPSDKQIDQEIEELKRKYGMMSRETTAPSNYTASYMDRYTRSPVPGVSSRPGFTTYTSRVTQSSYDPRARTYRPDTASPSVFSKNTTPSLPPYSQSSVFGRSDSSQKFRPR